MLTFKFSNPAASLANVWCVLLLLLMASTGWSQEPNPKINPTVKPRHDRPADSDEAAIERVQIDLYAGSVEDRVAKILSLLTLEEKIGQLSQISVGGNELPAHIAADIRHSRVGSVFYTGEAEVTREAKRIAVEESRLGIPLLTPRDVIHGFRTVFPIPLAQAASWNPDLIEQAARVAAREARAEGINWTFAPMIDISRDARWGRIAESAGEDPCLASAYAKASVTGYQKGSDTSQGIAACGKHFVAYGLSEGGRDYNRAEVSCSELHNVFLKPFEAAKDAGCMTFMTGFNTINGIPATGHRELLRGELKGKWGFDGFVVSDWSSVVEMIEHGYAKNRRQAALRALTAGLDMEMATSTYGEHLRDLVDSGQVKEAMIDEAVARILRVKLRVALPPMDSPSEAAPTSSKPTAESLALAKRLTTQSIVLLKNTGVLPLDRTKLQRVAVIGPLADASRDQMGCWMLDGRPDETSTPLVALREALGDGVEIRSVAALESPIDESTDLFADAVSAAEDADVALVFVGESWWMNGEARSRVDLSLSGAQSDLLRRVAATKTPTVLVCLAGRPLTIGRECEVADAVLYAWHPGTMGGPALVDLLLGVESPSGKLPVTFPKHVGQVPLYYNHPQTGRPALAGTTAIIGTDRADFPEEQKYRSHYIDSDPFPLFPFGFGLSYTAFEYGDIELSTAELSPGQTLAIRVPITNVGDREGEEVAQLYVADVTASIVRPVRELKDFRRVRLSPQEKTILEFALPTDELAYFDNQGRQVLEPGEFRVGIGGNSDVPLTETFVLNGRKLAGQSGLASPAGPSTE